MRKPAAKSPDRPSSKRDASRWQALGVVTLLAAHWALAVAGVRHKSATFDEVGHLTAGVGNWRTGDFRLLPEHPPLTHLWAALPVILSDYREPAWAGPDWAGSQVWNLGRTFLYDLGNDADGLLLRARAAMALFSGGIGALVWWWSKSLFGPAAGLLALAIFAFDPTMLAHAPLVTTDAAVSLFFLLSVWAWWRVLDRATWWTALTSALAAAALALTKVSGVLILPMAAALVVARCMRGRPSAKQFAAWAGAGAVHVVIVVGLIWACYGFRYSAMREAQPGRDRFFTPAPLPPGQDPWEYELEGLGLKGRLIGWARDRRLLPESYLFGFASTVRHAGFRAAYFNGETSIHGWRTFFPYCFAVKTPLALFAMLALAAWAKPSARGEAPARWPRRWADGFFRTAPLWALFAVYWITAIQSNLNIGHRHILPIYPVLYILAGRAALWFGDARRWCRMLPLLPAAALLAISLVQFPHYLSFFNSLVGGPKRAYRHLVDSSLDWGQDLPELKRWLGAHASDARPVYLSYFGTAKPSYYGIDAEMLPSLLPWKPGQAGELKGGTYCISATMLQQVGLLPECKWTQAMEEAYQALLAHSRAEGARVSQGDLSLLLKLRFARLCAFVRQREPDDHVGYSILIYRLNDGDVREALAAQPAELMPDGLANLQRLAEHAFEATSFTAARVFCRRLIEGFGAGGAEPEPSWYVNGAAAEAATGRGAESLALLQRGLGLFPDHPMLNNNLAWLRATHPSAELRDGEEALRHARRALEASSEKDPDMLDTLAAALAESGNLEEAVKTAQEAHRVALRTGNTDLARQIESRIALYAARKPYREERPPG